MSISKSEIREWADSNFKDEGPHETYQVFLGEVKELDEAVSSWPGVTSNEYMNKIKEEGGDALISLFRFLMKYDLDPLVVLKERWDIVKRRRYRKGIDGKYKKVEPRFVSTDHLTIIKRSPEETKDGVVIALGVRKFKDEYAERVAWIAGEANSPKYFVRSFSEARIFESHEEAVEFMKSIDLPYYEMMIRNSDPLAYPLACEAEFILTVDLVSWEEASNA